MRPSSTGQTRRTQRQRRSPRFLLPERFFEEVHQQIFDICAKLLRSPKLTSPITLKTFFQGEEIVPCFSARQYLARVGTGASQSSIKT